MSSASGAPPRLHRAVSNAGSHNGAAGGVGTNGVGAGSPFQRHNGAGFGRTASLRGTSTTSKMAKMEKDFRAEIERLQNVIDVTNQIIEERQVTKDQG